MDVGDLAVEKGYLSPERLQEIRESLVHAKEKGLTSPNLTEMLVLRGHISQEAANSLEDEMLIRSPEPPRAVALHTTAWRR